MLNIHSTLWIRSHQSLSSFLPLSIKTRCLSELLVILGLKNPFFSKCFHKNYSTLVVCEVNFFLVLLVNVFRDPSFSVRRDAHPCADYNYYVFGSVKLCFFYQAIYASHCIKYIRTHPLSLSFFLVWFRYSSDSLRWMMKILKLKEGKWNCIMRSYAIFVEFVERPLYTDDNLEFQIKLAIKNADTMKMGSGKIYNM